MADLKEMKVSVRNLVEFILRSGDIDNRRGSVYDKDAMQAGSKIHRKIQKRMGSDYHAEYSLKKMIASEKFNLIIEGRADGIIIKEDSVTIDEIKGTYMELGYLEAPISVHRAQAMCYAYIYGSKSDLKIINIQMTYVNLDTEEIKYFTEEFSVKYLETWFLDLTNEYLKWMNLQYEWMIKRKDSIGKIEFPFVYRGEQKKLAASVYRTIEREKTLFIQAPTGVGKTMSVVFPAVKAVGEEHSDKIFYLTAKTITRTVAKEAFDILKGNGLEYKVVTITAKEKFCLCDEMDCNPVHCEYAKGHFDRVNDGVFELIQKETDYSRETILEYALKYRLCPFEFCLDISNWSDAIICDYNYVFDPNVYLKRFFSDGVKGNYIFLVDEAHNLVDRGREMYSASLYKEDFLEIKKDVKGKNRKLTGYLERCNKTFLEWKRECDTYTVLSGIGHLILTLMSLVVELEKFLEEEQDKELRKKVLGFYLQVRSFINIHDRLDENYVIYSEHDEEGKFKVKLFCINPGKNLKEFLDKGNGTIFFSATLLPICYYKELLGSMEDYAVYADSPFDQGKKLLLIGKDVSSKYTRRNPGEYKKIKTYLLNSVKKKPGNYLVFFPSYRFMEEIFELVTEETGVTCIKQSPNMNEEKREEFLDCFLENNEGILLGFCVLGGVFGEGIDLKHERLIGTIIVGTGIPGICNEREILKYYYDQNGKNGFDFSYRYPGMNKVLQAAGRVIRTDKDKGIILLLDERFHSLSYKNLFPREWNDYKPCTLENMESQIEDFWSEVPAPLPDY